MRITNLYDGYAVIELHWEEARILVAAIGDGDLNVPKEIGDWRHAENFKALLEALALAGRLQLLSAETEKLTLERFRETPTDDVIQWDADGQHARHASATVAEAVS